MKSILQLHQQYMETGRPIVVQNGQHTGYLAWEVTQ